MDARLKKIRNPERMVRIAVGYTGHTPPKSDDTDANNEPGQLKIYLPKKLLECLPKCSSLPKERHRWNTNESLPMAVTSPVDIELCAVVVYQSKA
ncbi:hypothetical protein PAMA_010339 [Pampus argenteus]